MGISAAAAAEMVGMSKAGILKAVKTGKISATKNVQGQWEIEPVEVLRVYAPVHRQVDTSPQPSIDSLQRENELLRETVADLRQRLDVEAEERRKLTLILTDAQRPRSWWARLLSA